MTSYVSYVPKFKKGISFPHYRKYEKLFFDFDDCHCEPYCEEHNDSAFKCPEDCEQYVEEYGHSCWEIGGDYALIDSFEDFLASVKEELENFYLYECGFARKESKWHSLVKGDENNLGLTNFVISGFSDDEEQSEYEDDDLFDAFRFLDNKGYQKGFGGILLPAFWMDFSDHFSFDELRGSIEFTRESGDHGRCYSLEFQGCSVYFVNPHFLRSRSGYIAKDRSYSTFYTNDCLFRFFNEYSIGSIAAFKGILLERKDKDDFPFRIQLKSIEDSVASDLVLEMSDTNLALLFVDSLKTYYHQTKGYDKAKLESEDLFEDREDDYFPCIVQLLSIFLNKLYGGIIQAKPGDSVKIYLGADYNSSYRPFVLEHKYFRFFYTPYYQGIADRELSCFSPFLSKFKGKSCFSFDFDNSDVCLVDSEIWGTEDFYY
jgi:hypothetical protein